MSITRRELSIAGLRAASRILCMSLRRTSEVVAKEILDNWFDTAYEPNQVDDECLEQVEAIEREYVRENRGGEY